MRAPTEKQYQRMISLGSGAMGFSFTKRDTDPLLNHGWVTAEWKPPYYQGVRITPDGLRALAAAVERYGLPSMAQPARIRRRVCSDCGSSSYRFEQITEDEYLKELAA
jgi:hypothetical protein